MIKLKKILPDLISLYFRKFQFYIDTRLTKDKTRKYEHLFTGHLLDIGAGDKPYENLFTKVESYIGTNTATGYDSQMRKQIERFTDYWIEDGTSLPFQDESFDCVVSYQVLPVFENPDLFFREVHRVLIQDGLFMVATNFMYPEWSDIDILRHTPNGLNKIAGKTGFSLVAQESYGSILTTLYSIILKYWRNYPAVIASRKHPIHKLTSLVIFLFILLFQPFLSVIGMFIYLLEKNKTSDFATTVNSLLVVRKSG